MAGLAIGMTCDLPGVRRVVAFGTLRACIIRRIREARSRLIVRTTACAHLRDTDTRIDGKRDRQPGVFPAGRDLLRTVQMDKIETAAAGVRSARPARRIAEIDPLAAAVTTFFGELFLSPSRRRIVMTPSLDDHKLVEACRAGQTEAFGALVQRYQERLYQVLLHLSGSPEDAQGRFARHVSARYEKLDQFHGDSSFYTWVYRIGVNLALSGHRQAACEGRGQANG